LETETTYPATAEGLRDAAREIAENVTSTETVTGADKPLLEVEGAGLPPEVDGQLCLKDAAQRLVEHRQQREDTREKLNRAIGLDDEPDDLQSNYK
jgi:hypothetical protein